MSERADDLDPYVPERGNRGYEATSYELDLDYAISSNLLEGRARIAAVALDGLRRFSLDLAGLRAAKVTVDGTPARWRQQGAKLHVDLPSALVAGERFTVDVRYGGNPKPARSTWGPVGWEELTDGVLVAAQPSGASTWFPCNDLARQKATYRVAVTAASSYRVVVNGALVDRTARGSRTTWTYEQPEPTSPYLVTCNIGHYDEVVLADGDVDVRAVLPAGQRRRFDAAFARQVEMTEVLGDLFGPYPFAAGYTVVVTGDPLEVPLEAQGQAIFGSNHLDGSHERLIAHELAHQWFGNSLTASSWRDVWLHEGFACYAEWLWSERAGERSADDLARQHHRRLAASAQDLVLADPGPADMFDDRVYKRGALTLHALRLRLGDVAFFGLLRRWTAAHRHDLVTTADLLALADDVAGTALDLSPWLDRTELPALEPVG